MPFIPDEKNSSFMADSSFKPEKTFIQKLATKAPLFGGVVGGVATLPAGLAPTGGGAGAGWGEIVNQGFNPSPVSSKYTFGQKVSQEDLPAFRAEKIGEMGKVMSTTAAGAVFWDIIQAFIGKPSDTKQIVKTVTNPKQAALTQKSGAIDQSTSKYSGDDILKSVLDWNGKQGLTPSTSGKEKQATQLTDSATSLFSGKTFNVGDLSKIKTTAWEKSYTPYGLKQSLEAKVNTQIASTIKTMIEKNDRSVANWDKLYGLLSRVQNVPVSLLKATGAGMILSKLGIRF